MKTKLKIFAIFLLVAYSFTFSFEKKSDDKQFNYVNVARVKQAHAGGGESSPLDMYQTMAYCSAGRLTYACKSSYTAERCWRYVCLVSW